MSEILYIFSISGDGTHAPCSPKCYQINLFSNESVDSKTKTKRLKGGGVSVPFMITREMFRELISIGYSEKEINNMKSEKAHRILTST